jgi:hypothetical protein
MVLNVVSGGGGWNDSHVYSQKFMHRQSRVSRYLVVVEKPIPRILLFRSILPHVFLQMS